MPRIRDFRNDFSAGAVAEEFLSTGNEELARESLVTGKNTIITNARTLRRRPGSLRMATLTASGRPHVIEMDDETLRFVVFSDDLIEIYEEDGTLEWSDTAPWSGETVYEMAVARSRDPAKRALYVTHNDFWPQIIEYDGSNWSIADYAFRTTGSGRKAGLFSRFTREPITLTLSAYTGTGVTATFSDDWLVAGHVGVTFVYMECQIVVTAVTNETTATVTIIDRIYPTLRVSVDSVTPYSVGEIISGDVTAVSGQVIAIGADYIDVVLDSGYTYFLAPDGDAPGEKISGRNGFAECTGVSLISTPGATNIWFEDVISDVHGYPGTCTIHRGRLLFAGFPKLGNAVAGSAVGSEDDFDLGGGRPADAVFIFLDEIPDDRILHLVGGEQLVALTENTALHAEESGEQPFSAQNPYFKRISPDGAAKVPPAVTPEGILFVDELDRIIVLSQTGTAQRAWAPGELSVLGYHLISSPRQLVYAPGFGGRNERILAVLNADGTAAVFCNRRGAEQGGWLPWERKTGDSFDGFAEYGGRFFCTATVDDAGASFLEEMSYSAVIDAEVTPATGGEAGEVAHITLGSHVVLEVTLDGSGDLPDLGTLSGIEKIGHDFTVEISPAPYIQTQVGRQRRRVAKAYADVLNTGTFRMNNRLCQDYRSTTDIEAPPLLVTREYKASQRGSGTHRTILIEQREGEGSPFELRSLTMEVMVK